MMKLNDLLADHQLYHSEFQQDYLITARAGGTTYGQYKQALRELFKRKRGLEELYSERELLIIDIEELEATTSDNEFEQRRNDVKLKQKRGHLYDMDKNVEDTEREFKRFYQQAVALKGVIGELTEERRRELDEDMWRYKIKEMAAIDYMSHNRLGNVTIEMLKATPMEMRVELSKLILDPQKHQTLINWYIGHEEETVKLNDAPDIKGLIE